MLDRPLPIRRIDMSCGQASFAVTLVIAALATPARPAMSQEINPLVRERIMVQALQPQGDRRTVRVQLGINFFLPGPTNDSDEAAKIRDRARRTVYDMAGRECGVLLDTIAAECRLESITLNLNRQVTPMGQMGQMGQAEGFMANGQLGFQITPK
jgi:hypothetical protein